MTTLFLQAQMMQAQVPGSWHHGGLYALGMHWGWWIFWIAAVLIVGWAFWRLRAEQREQRRDAMRKEAAEEILRQRLARGEIDEEQFAARLRALRESHVPEMR
ncbi:MAG: SHOCT domain-containing protein [Gemmatimonadetes bacterium]|nr:SHOCT domain-containing protein [Gemmatimonadota bacterium]